MIMKTFLTCFLSAFLPLVGLAQAPILRNPSTTNQFMNLPSSGTVPLWNSTAGKWSNAPAGTASAAGNSGAVQFNEGGAFAGTNRFLYDRTNEVFSLIGSSAGSVRLYDSDSSHSVNLIGNATLSSNLNLTFPHSMSNGLLSVVSVNDSNFNIAVIPHGAANPLTNNDTRAIQFGDSLYVAGSATNASDTRTEGVALFTSDITQPSGNTASLGAATINDLLYAKTNLQTDANISYRDHVVSGTGGANTNFTLLASIGKAFINGFTNVSIRAIMGGVAGYTHTFSITITNGSGSNRTLEFSPVTNAWKWSYAQGAIAPTVLTNSEQIIITGELSNTNVTAAYAYYPWP